MIDSKLCVIFVTLVLQVLFVYNQEEPNEEFNRNLETTKNCKCVRYYQCDENNTIIANGVNMIGFRIDKPRPICRGGDFNGDFVCCNLPANISTKQPVPVVTHPPSLLKCGFRGPFISGRVYSEDEDDSRTVDGEFPWIAAVHLRKQDGDYKFRCSGSLIHPSVVLTSEHNIHGKNVENMKVIVNGKAMLTNVGSDPDQERDVQEIIHHNDYYEAGYHNDVSLLILKKPYNITKKVNVICLPPDNIDLLGKKCVVAGWGEKPDRNNSKIMSKVEVPFVPHEKCQKQLSKEMGFQFDLDSSFMCAGGEKGNDACKGDGGAPLVCRRANSSGFFQIGIVSWGLGCGREDIPGVYTDVWFLQSWIREELNKRNISISRLT